ncbi:MAG: diguanylate cyclase [Actinomycetota bacterium]|nr:diguanylate cyclase [Actinomycetota bacterium]
MNVVVVDDDPVVRLVLTRMVSSLGHTALAADTAAAALRLVERNPVDVVISDWMMPEVNGLELCEMVRARDTVEYIYFILVTALDDREHAMTALAGGVDDCLVKPIDAFHLQLRLMVADRVTGLHREIAERHRGLERTNIEAAASARTDALTGLGNRRKLDEDLEVFRSRRDRYRQPFGVALFDLDHFKTLNDTAGHQAGDEALRRVAAVIRRELREADMAYRYGGEELMVILPAGVRRVAAAAERIRQAVEDAAIPHPGRPGTGTVVTLSAGVAAAEGDAVAFLAVADTALYRAKSEGRNRVAVSATARPGALAQVGIR